MVMRKIAVDNSVRYVPKSEKLKKERDNKPKTIKAGSLPRRRNKNISRKIKKILNKIAANDFGIFN